MEFTAGFSIDGSNEHYRKLGELVGQEHKEMSERKRNNRRDIRFSTNARDDVVTYSWSVTVSNWNRNKGNRYWFSTVKHDQFPDLFVGSRWAR